MNIRTVFFLPLSYYFGRCSITLLFSSAALLLSLSACSPQHSTPPSETMSATPLTAADNIQRLLQQLRNSDGRKREQLQLELIDLLLQEQQRDLASQILTGIDAALLTPVAYINYCELQTRLQLQRGQYNEALTTLDNERLASLNDQFSLEQQLGFTSLRAKVLALLGSHLASAQQRIYNDPLLNPEEQINNRKSIWRSLMYVSLDDLNHYQRTAFGKEYQGWLSLALIAKSSQGDLDEQVRQLDQWLLTWPEHPATQQLPEDLSLIRELAANQAKQIAIVLPLTGKLSAYGQAIRDGLMAAHYRAQQNNTQTPIIKIYDSATNTPFIQLYQQIVNEGAEVIIGPLNKGQLRLLFDEDISLPTLALNRIDDYGQAPAQLFQFGLSPEDEAQQIAELAFIDKHRQALLISPKGRWGEKVSNAFTHHWQDLGGTVLENTLFTGQRDYSQSIKNSLHLQHSESRARRIQKLAGEHIEFHPRRRQDIDMIFLLARPEQARSIKPLLNYHYASSLPIYATSRIYGGYDDIKKDRDINGITFTDIPWVLNPDSALKLSINKELHNSKFYQRMYALGIDSYQLYPRLKQLQKIPESRVYGETGALKLNANNQIQRTVLLAKIKRGRAKRIASADQSLNESPNK